MRTRGKRTLIASVAALGIGVLSALPSSLAGAATTTGTTGTTGTPLAATGWPACRSAGHNLMRLPGFCFARTATPAPGTGGSLVGVSADSPSDAWAVGNYSTPKVRWGAFLAHWNGVKWTKVASPDPGDANSASLVAVTARSPKDAWAVGFYNRNGGNERPLILHWDGTRWSQVPSPDPSGGAELFAVSVDSYYDAWAVGISGGTSKTFMLHWNGIVWTQVKAPSPGWASIMNAVSAQSPTNAWAVGYYASSDTSPLRPVTLHWNGTRWTQVASPVPASATGNVGLLGVTTVSADDAWATGYAASGLSASPLLLRWNGKSWASIRIPAPPKAPKGYHEATVLSSAGYGSAKNVMVTGWYVLIDPAFGTAFTDFTVRWNGKSWTELPSPLPNDDVQMFGASVISTVNAWTVGSDTVTLPNGLLSTGTLTMFWNGIRWVETPSPY